MGIHSTYYAALMQYLQALERDKAYRSFAAALRGANDEEDVLKTVRHTVTVKDDWITYIEERLPNVERAVHAERQFITQNGEIMRIDQVRQVTPASVAHLAKHSNLITHLPDNPEDKPIPDSLYVEKKISDYAVYENRFLYLLLVTLRDFCAERLKKIREASRLTDVSLRAKKTFAVVNHRVTYSLKLTDANTNDEDNQTDETTKKKVSRIEDIYGNVNGMLSTPLMQDMSLVPMIHPPIKMTNVLKMNVDFKKALELFQYVMAYKKDGFTIEEKEETLHPLPEEMLRELTALIGTETYLADKYGMGLTDKLASAYREAQAAEQEKARRALDAREEELRNHVRDNGGDPIEYIDVLEQQIKLLRGDNRELLSENERARSSEETLAKDAENMTRANDELRQALAERTATVDTLEKEARENEERYEQTVCEVRAEAEDAVNAARRAQEEALHACDVLLEQKALAEAQVKGLRELQGTAAVGETPSVAKYRALETEYRAFKKMMRKEWKSTAAMLRKRALQKQTPEIDAETKGEDEP